MAFEAHQLEEYLSQFRLSIKAEQFIREAANKLSRDVGGTSYPCVVVEDQSDKMGVTVNTESRRGELGYALQLEMDDNVVSFYEQAPPVDCLRTDKNGREVWRAYRADFVVLLRSGPIVAQVKPEQTILEKLRKYPSDWLKQENAYVDLPAEKAFKEIGIPHYVISTADLPPIRVSNLQLLLQVRRQSVRKQISELVTARIQRVLRENAAMRVSELATYVHLEDLSPIFNLVLNRGAYVDLDHQLLSQPDSCWISDNPMLLDALLEDRRRTQLSVCGDPCSLYEVPPKKQAERALKNLKMLKKHPNTRHARRLRARIRQTPQSPFLAVTPKNYLSGNHLAKRPAAVLAFADQYLRDHWACNERPSIPTAHRLYKVDAGNVHPGETPVTLPTFRRRSELMRVEAARARGGTRAANAAMSPTDVSERVIKSTRPFELATIDHCLAKIYCVLLKTESRIYICQPWLTVMRDCYTGDVLAAWVAIAHPSRRACAMALRSCLRRFGRLPEGIVADGGPEFRSVYWSALLAHCGVRLVKRPKSHCRYGSEAERFFGLFKSLWLDARPGNRTDIKVERAISGSHKAENFAQLSLPDFLREVEDFRGWLASVIAAGQTMPPTLLRDEGLKRFPFSGMQLPYDDNFIIASAVDEAKYSLDPSRGIQIGPRHYWHPGLADATKRKDLEVRKDPEDHARIYVRIKSNWLCCRSSRDPLISVLDSAHRIAESVIVLEGFNVREAAKNDIDRLLVLTLREADARLNHQVAVTDSPDAGNPAATQDQLWEEVRNAHLSEANTSIWGEAA